MLTAFIALEDDLEFGGRPSRQGRTAAGHPGAWLAGGTAGRRSPFSGVRVRVSRSATTTTCLTRRV